jgi:hypothetical protein
MADILCGYTADRDETLVAYLYGDIEPSQRAAFDAHIATCERCRHELEDLRRLRGELRTFTVPELGDPLALPLPPRAAVIPLPDVVTGPGARPWYALRDVPAWARVAAAMLVLGVSAGIAGGLANLDVRYERGGITVRTGWSHSAGQTAVPQAATGAAAAPAPPWKEDLDSLERRLRSELREAQPPAAVSTAARADQAGTGADAQLLRKVRALVEDSERRQRNELALNIAEVVQEFDAKRGTDLANIRNMKTIQSATGLEVVRQQQWLNLLTQASAQSR